MKRMGQRRYFQFQIKPVGILRDLRGFQKRTIVCMPKARCNLPHSERRFMSQWTTELATSFYEGVIYWSKCADTRWSDGIRRNKTSWHFTFYQWNVESGVMNASFMTNYSKVSRGWGALLFVLGAEILALKIRQNQVCRGIELPNGQEDKISQFADDTILIVDNTGFSKRSLTVWFNLWLARLNKKKTKVMWISASRKNKSEHLEFNFHKDPINNFIKVALYQGNISAFFLPKRFKNYD